MVYANTGLASKLLYNMNILSLFYITPADLIELWFRDFRQQIYDSMRIDCTILHCL